MDIFQSRSGQDLLRKNAKNIFKDVVKKGGHIYLSGDENMIYSCKQVETESKEGLWSACFYLQF